MFGLKGVVSTIKAYVAAIDDGFRECGGSSRATLANDMCASIVRELEALILVIETDEDLPQIPAGTIYIDGNDNNLEKILGRKFVRRAKQLKDLGSLAIQEIVNAAAAIGEEAAEDRAQYKDPAQESKDVVSAQGLKLLAIHFVSDDIQNHGCALERTFDSLYNQLVGARMMRLARRLEAQTVVATVTPAADEKGAAGK